MTQVHKEVYFTKGRVIVHSKTPGRDEKKKAAYLLFCKVNITLTVTYAKDHFE